MRLALQNEGERAAGGEALGWLQWVVAELAQELPGGSVETLLTTKEMEAVSRSFAIALPVFLGLSSNFVSFLQLGCKSFSV